MRNRENTYSSTADFISCLEEEFERRRKKNPRYSLRAFSKSLNYHAGSLSSLLARKRPLTPKAIAKLANNLALPNEQVVHYTEQAMRPRLQLDSPDLIEDAQSVLTEWFHFQLLDLTHRNDFLMDYSWMAQEIGIEERLAKKGWERLLRLKLVKLVGKQWADQLALMRLPAKKNSTVSHPITSPTTNSISLTISENTLVELLIQMRKFFSQLTSVSTPPGEGLKISLRISAKVDGSHSLQNNLRQKN